MVKLCKLARPPERVFGLPKERMREKTGGAATGLGKQSVVYANASQPSARKLCRRMTYEKLGPLPCRDAEIRSERGY